jgi:septum formation protein
MFHHIRDLSLRVPLVLASGSPRRQQLLSETGSRFTIETHDVDETRRANEPAFQFAVRLAEEKALAVETSRQTVVLGFDTIVVVDDLVLGKPGSKDQAFEMLRLLSGRRHEVCTAVAMARTGRIFLSQFDVTCVYFHAVTDSQIRDYIEGGEPMDKAGSYGIQGMGGFLVDRIEGNIDTVVGLPRDLLDRMAATLLEKL